MNTLDFFIKKADSIWVDCYSSGWIDINICMERNDYGRIRRAINISKDKEGLVELSCYEDWGDDGKGSAFILDDELQVLMGFISSFKAGNDQISQISSLLSLSGNDTYKMSVSASSVAFTWNCGTYDQYSCIVFRNQEPLFEGSVPEELKKEMQRVARLIWKKNNSIECVDFMIYNDDIVVE